MVLPFARRFDLRTAASGHAMPRGGLRHGLSRWSLLPIGVSESTRLHPRQSTPRWLATCGSHRPPRSVAPCAVD